MKTVKNNFLTGLIVILPFFLTAYIIWFLFQLVGMFFTPAITKIFELILVAKMPGVLVTFTSAAITLFLIWLVGVLVSNFIGEKFFHFAESVLLKIPMARGIYEAISKLTNIFLSDKSSFKRVVLIEWPRKGVYSIAFITSEETEAIQRATKQNVVSVFMPTTPNPTSGFLVLVPKEDVIPLDMSIDDAMKLIISGGIVVPTSASSGKSA